MSLSTQQKRYLKGLAHHLQAIVTVADKGLNTNVMAELEVALDKHELVKVKLRAERTVRKDWIDEIGSRCNAECVQAIGQMACFFRRNSKKPVITLPGKA